MKDIEKDLEHEILKASSRIENRQGKINIEISELSIKIKTFTNWAWIFVWIGFGITLFGTVYYIFKNTEVGYGLNLLGDFMAGTVSSIWSLAGLFFIYVAFLGQKQQLLNQQVEIMFSQLEVKYTRLELAGQKKEMATQNATLIQQKFENTFFQLLGLFNNISNTIDITSGQKTYTGRDCFKVLYEMLKSTCKNEKVKSATGGKITFEELMEGYSIFYKLNMSDLSHYFRTIYHIFKFIDTSEIDNKERYTSLVRSQLSSYEQILIFYNCLHSNGLKKFKPLLEKYMVFKNIDDSLILNQKHKKRYEDVAFGKNN
ncbi:putative phage abortive infection protein [Tenacibaculum piscium]|uniref:putative phage abortive infection protein n=1 Tax=Tenacibaculum piscium TaxID=1458515 RepID=UPI001F425568|nr:putative phage abortive infection protein [Tenacibaculum piscium]